VFSLIVSIVYGILGLILVVFGVNGETYINEFCAGSYEDAGISDLILNID